MKIVVIDGQGGGMGKSIVAQIVGSFPKAMVAGIGTNSLASSAMLKAGATYVATGEHAVVHNCKNADIIVGAIGICFAHSMHGEISSKMAKAISKSSAKKILIPMTKCNVTVLGVKDASLGQYILELIEEIKQYSNFIKDISPNPSADPNN